MARRTEDKDGGRGQAVFQVWGMDVTETQRVCSRGPSSHKKHGGSCTSRLHSPARGPYCSSPSTTATVLPRFLLWGSHGLLCLTVAQR